MLDALANLAIPLGLAALVYGLGMIVGLGVEFLIERRGEARR